MPCPGRGMMAITLTAQGASTCRSWSPPTAPRCSPLASCSPGTHFGASWYGTLKPQGSLGWSYCLFLLRSELQLPAAEARSSFELLHCHRCKFQLHQIHPTSLSWQNMSWFLISVKFAALYNFKAIKKTLPIFCTGLDFTRPHVLNK